MRREELPDRSVRIAADDCSFTYYRPALGVVYIEIQGTDRGAFGTAVTNEMAGDLSAFAPIELFIDTTDVLFALPEVAELWTKWFSTNRGSLKSVNILVRSKFIHVTVEVAKLFSRTGNLIRVYLDPQHFQAALERAAPRGCASIALKRNS